MLKSGPHQKHKNKTHSQFFTKARLSNTKRRHYRGCERGEDQGLPQYGKAVVLDDEGQEAPHKRHAREARVLHGAECRFGSSFSGARMGARSTSKRKKKKVKCRSLRNVRLLSKLLSLVLCFPRAVCALRVDWIKSRRTWRDTEGCTQKRQGTSALCWSILALHTPRPVSPCLSTCPSHAVLQQPRSCCCSCVAKAQLLDKTPRLRKPDLRASTRLTANTAMRKCVSGVAAAVFGGTKPQSFGVILR